MGRSARTGDEDGTQKQRYARANIPEKLRDLVDHPPLDSARELIERRIGFDRVSYCEGWYEETLASYDGRAIAFASVDCDYYGSVKLVLDFIHDKATPGYTILIDDYGDVWAWGQESGCSASPAAPLADPARYAIEFVSVLDLPAAFQDRIADSECLFEQLRPNPGPTFAAGSGNGHWPIYPIVIVPVLSDARRDGSGGMRVAQALAAHP